MASNKLFNTLLTNVSNELVNVPKRLIVAHLTNSLASIIAAEAALLENDPETIGAVHYKPLIDRNTQIARYKGVEAKNDHNLKIDWRSEVHLSSDYAEYLNQFLSTFSKF